MIVRTIADLRVRYDDDGAPWFELGEVAQLLHQPTTTHLSRHIQRGRRRVIPVGRRLSARRFIHLIDGQALIEAHLAVGQMPLYEVRDFVRRLRRAPISPAEARQ